FVARDATGNTSSGSREVTVQAPQAGPPPAAPPPAPVPTPVPPTGPARDTTPPRDVRNLVAKAGDRTVSLSWISPGDADFDHVSVVRSTATAGAAAREIYRGTRESVRDRGLKNNV